MVGEGLVVAEGVGFFAGERDVLEGVGVTLFGGEVVGVCGGNGVGKTTLLRILAGLLTADEGTVRYCLSDSNPDPDPDRENLDSGENPPGQFSDDGGDWREEVLFLGHRAGVCSLLTPLENLQALAGLRGREVMGDLSAALMRWGVALDVPCGRLSAGQVRRVGLARLSVVRARVWILDEPLVSLDAAGRERFFVELRRHLDSGGGAVVSCHLAEELPDACRVLHLDGRPAGVLDSRLRGNDG